MTQPQSTSLGSASLPSHFTWGLHGAPVFAEAAGGVGVWCPEDAESEGMWRSDS